MHRRTQTDIDIDRHRQIQTRRDRYIHRQTDTDIDRHRYRHGETDSYINRQTHIDTKNRQTQTYKDIDKHTQTQT